MRLNLLFIAMTSIIFTSCDSVKMAQRSYLKAQKAIAEADTLRAKDILYRSFTGNYIGSDNLHLYSDIVMNQNCAHMQNSREVNEDELLGLIQLSNKAGDRTGLKDSVVSFLIKSKVVEPLTVHSFESIFTYYQFRYSDSTHWVQAHTLYDFIRDPELAGVVTSDELELFSQQVYRQIDSLFSVSLPSYTMEQKLINMMVMKVKTQYCKEYFETKKFHELKIGFPQYYDKLKEFESEVRKAGRSVNVASYNKAILEKEFLNNILLNEFKNFLEVNADSLPVVNDEIQKALDGPDLLGAFISGYNLKRAMGAYEY